MYRMHWQCVTSAQQDAQELQVCMRGLEKYKSCSDRWELQTCQDRGPRSNVRGQKDKAHIFLQCIAGSLPRSIFRMNYFQEGPENLEHSCDMLMVLNDGSRLPAHTQVLAAHSCQVCLTEDLCPGRRHRTGPYYR